MNLDIIHPKVGRSSGGDPEAGFIERWADRKARRAFERAASRPMCLVRAAEQAGSPEDAAQRCRPAIAQVHRPDEAPGWRGRSSRIIREVAERTGVSMADIIGHSRLPHIVRARHEAAWRIRQETTLSSRAIGERFGGRDHKTILKGIRAHQRRLDDAEARP